MPYKKQYSTKCDAIYKAMMHLEVDKVDIETHIETHIETNTT